MNILWMLFFFFLIQWIFFYEWSLLTVFSDHRIHHGCRVIFSQSLLFSFTVFFPFKFANIANINSTKSTKRKIFPHRRIFWEQKYEEKKWMEDGNTCRYAADHHKWKYVSTKLQLQFLSNKFLFKLILIINSCWTSPFTHFIKSFFK